MQIALFGGAFDPPHLGHAQVAREMLRSGVVDEVWFVPVFTHPWAQKLGKFSLSEYSKRLKMLELQLADKQRVAEYTGVSFTYDTLAHFKNKFPQHTFSWVMGSEYVSKFDLFLADHPKLLDFTFYIYPRAGFPVAKKQLYPNMILLEDLPEMSISSTQVREHAAAQLDFRKLVAPDVGHVIEDEKLYKKQLTVDTKA